MPLNKYPDAVKDYGFNWSQWMATSDSISTSTFSAGVCAVTSSSISVTSHMTTCFIGSGGTAGTTYRVTNKITTAQGRVEFRDFELLIL